MYAIAVLNNSYGKAKHRNIKTMGILRKWHIYMNFSHLFKSAKCVCVCVSSVLLPEGIKAVSKENRI